MKQFIMQHYGTILSITAAVLSHLFLLLTAAVRTMPNPGVPLDRQAMYKWLFDWLHQAFNVTSDESLIREKQLQAPSNPTLY